MLFFLQIENTKVTVKIDCIPTIRLVFNLSKYLKLRFIIVSMLFIDIVDSGYNKGKEKIIWHLFKKI